jgi:hypothetical protein
MDREPVNFFILFLKLFLGGEPSNIQCLVIQANQQGHKLCRGSLLQALIKQARWDSSLGWLSRPSLRS